MKTSLFLLCICTLLSVSASVLSAQTGSLRGQILDSNDAPVAGTRIHVLGTSRGAVSKPNGDYFITGIEAGNYTLEVSYTIPVAYSHRIVSLTLEQVRVNAGEITELQIRLPKDSAVLPADTIVAAEEEIDRAIIGIQRPFPPTVGGGFDIRPRRPQENLRRDLEPGTLSGNVIDTGSMGIPGAVVRIVGTEKGAMVREADGSFQVKDVPPGTYTLKVSAIGMKSKEVTVEILPEKDTEIVIILEDPPAFEDDPSDI